MNLAYGVMGYGRGHAMRTLAVLPALQARHEITVFAGGDAYEVLAPRVPTVRIPTLGYVYDAAGRHSLVRTVVSNVAPMRDLWLHGDGLRRLREEFRRRDIRLVISDSEAWTLRAARAEGIPTLGFDHIGVIAWCRPHFPPDLWAQGLRDAWGYRQIMGQPDRILISSFYPAQPKFPNVRVIGPILREPVRRAQPADGEHLLAYFNKGGHQFRPAVERALRQLDHPVVVYGVPDREDVENLCFRPPSDEGFVADLAACRAVIATAGSQLIGEALHLRKPLLVLPEDAFEQRLNAHIVERMGVGMRAGLRELTPSDVDRFLGSLDYYRSNMAEHARDARDEAVRILHADIARLTGGRTQAARAASNGRSPLDGYQYAAADSNSD